MHKRSFGSRVYGIADDLGIQQVVVNKIINSYIQLCKNELLSGKELRFVGLVNLVPNKLSTSYISTLAYHCKLISNDTSFTYHTVYAIISCYLSELKEDLLNGNSIDLRGIVSLHPLYRNRELVKIHASISTSIKTAIESNPNSIIDSARAHTCKLLKHTVQASLVNNDSDSDSDSDSVSVLQTPQEISFDYSHDIDVSEERGYAMR